MLRWRGNKALRHRPHLARDVKSTTTLRSSKEEQISTMLDKWPGMRMANAFRTIT